jgi:NAD-reducing hydrogenase small subunit
MSERKKARVATVWLDGCSGCHMSFLDMDERIIALADKIELVYSPLVDVKEFPAEVDLAIVEGAVATNEDLEKIQKIRKRTKFLLALGDCAVTGNVPAMRNPFGVEATIDRAFFENSDIQKQRPTENLPVLLDRVRPIHEVVKVDLFVPGCPPPADAIFFVVSELLEGRVPEPSTLTRFGQ